MVACKYVQVPLSADVFAKLSVATGMDSFTATDVTYSANSEETLEWYVKYSRAAKIREGGDVAAEKLLARANPRITRGSVASKDVLKE
jgi:hypothetical protein